MKLCEIYNPQKVSWLETSIDRGRGLICKIDGIVVGGIAWSYIPSSTGAAFASNRGKGGVSLIVSSEVNDKNSVIANFKERVNSRAEADAWARKTIKENNLKQKVVDEVFRLKI